MDGKKYEVVELTKDGHIAKMYFDPETHLLAIIKSKDPVSGMESTKYLLNYKDFNGIKFPTLIQLKQGDTLAQEISIDEVKINPEVDENIFEIPE